MSLLVLSVPLAELHDPENGRLDARRIAAFLDVPLARLAAGLGRRYQTLHKTPSAPAVQSGLLPIKQSLDILDQLLGGRALTLAWLNTPHVDLGGRTPLSLILDGHADAVAAMLAGALAGIPS